ncbi:5-(carboxyamino)imidazole ribonucleotide synthase [Lactococcus nasutitermitis]|uniref:N5-carboxyaminoimidazole ribonucleotide synthase n=1 Tax=Lactococcus nasutitermitis TaxID=1652957 RepID=A0ABV9JDJ8_9LACT|nr:5-(carboxyamino)imidazole ribonucleotide synthase [Lactococcus nasutitermitis]
MANRKKIIGIIGGGQLGQMMAISAQYMGHKVITLDPNSHCSAAKVSDEMIVADYEDVEALLKLAYACDVITYEFENVSATALHEIEDCVSIPQGIQMLEITQNRRFEKEFLASTAVKIAPWKLISSAQDLPSEVTKKQVLKTTTGGYDGHGQVVLRTNADLVEARDLADHAECVLEDFVSFEREISVVISGNGKDFVTFPLCENEHWENILHQTIVPARVSPEIAEKARQMALDIAEKLELSGTLCVEMFLSADGEIFVNELAPRPHNSGHFSIEACDFSQFDLHIKGILGEKLPEPELLKSAIMLNILGQHLAPSASLLESHPDWHIHDYGKPEAKHNRKMGHVTILTDDFEQTLEEIKATNIW